MIEMRSISEDSEDDEFKEDVILKWYATSEKTTYEVSKMFYRFLIAIGYQGSSICEGMKECIEEEMEILGSKQ